MDRSRTCHKHPVDEARAEVAARHRSEEILGQALLLGGVAYVAAVAIVFAARDVFPRAVALGPAEVAVMAVVIALICLAGSLVSIRAALRIEPQQALGG
jgi:putative ABC transport system permease protein